MTSHVSRIVPIAIYAAELLDLQDLALKEKESSTTELNSCSKEEKSSVQGLDLSHVPEGHHKRLRGLLTKFDDMWMAVLA